MSQQRMLDRQRKSREKLNNAVARYVNLRAGDGQHTDTVRTLDRAGRPVVVMVRLDIVPDPEVTQ